MQIDGHELTGRTPHDIAHAGLARTFQNLRLFPDLTVRENVDIAVLSAITSSCRSAPTSTPSCAAAGLADRQERRAGELDYGSSAGWSWCGRAATLRPAFSILDEPTSGMSDAESAVMIEHVRATAAAVGAGVLVIDHDLHFITVCDRIYVPTRAR